MTDHTITTPEITEPMTAKQAKAHAKAAKAHAKALRPWYKKPSRVVPLGVAGLLALVVATSGGSTDVEAAAPQSDTTVSAPAEQGSEAEATDVSTELAGIGDAVRDGKFEFTVTDVADGVGSVGDEFLGATAQGSYTLVTLTVANIGDEPQMFNDSNVVGIDSQGRELAADSSAGIYANENAEGFLTDINPGNSVSAVVVFDVAKGETLDQITVKDSILSGGAPISLK